MNEKMDLNHPANLPLPKDLDYHNSLNYRQPKPQFDSSETSDDKKKCRSSKTTPINIDTPQDFQIFSLLEHTPKMASQGTGGKAQQIGERAEATVSPRANIVNVADVADRLAGLSINSHKANYLAPDDIVKKYIGN